MMNGRALLLFALSGLAANITLAQSANPPAPPASYVRFDIYRNNVGICAGGLSRTLYQTSGTASSIALGACEQYISITTVIGTGGAIPDIGLITLTGGPTNEVGDIDVSIYGATTQRVLGTFGVTPTTARGNFGGISSFTTTSGVYTPVTFTDAVSSTNRPVRLWAGIQGNVTGPIRVQKLDYLRVVADQTVPLSGTIGSSVDSSDQVTVAAYVDGVDLTASIRVRGGTGTQLARARIDNLNFNSLLRAPRIVEVTTNQAVGGIRATSDSVDSVVVAGPFQAGSVSAPNGAVKSVVATSFGNFADVSISGRYVNRVDAGSGSFFGTISATDTATTAAQALNFLRASEVVGSVNVSRVQLAPAQSGNAIQLGGFSGTASVRDETAGPTVIANPADGAVSLGAVSSNVTLSGIVDVPVSVSSAVSGSLTLGNLSANGSLNVAGMVNIPITVASTASGSNMNFTGSIPAGQIVRINGTHAGTITTGATGFPNLAGQVIINSLDNGSLWSGVAKVGGGAGITLAPAPYYNDTPAVLGGGAVGLAPFAMHATGGLPLQDRLWSPAPVGTLASPSTADWTSTLKVTGKQFVAGTTTVPPVRMRFYGPISTTGVTECWGTRPPFKVERSATPDFASTVDVSHLFGWSRQENDREVRLQNSAIVSSSSCGLRRGYYRVSPATTPGIKSAGGVTGSPNVRDFRFYFRIDDSECNMNADVAGPNQSVGPDDFLTADDIIVFLGWYFAFDARADVAGPNQSTTPDGQFTADDVIVFLGNYFAGCNITACPDNPPACGEEEAGGGEGMMAAQSNAQAAAPQDPALALVQMIALESDPAKRSMLEFALGIVLGNASIGSSGSDR